jgi:hypothetical protein
VGCHPRGYSDSPKIYYAVTCTLRPDVSRYPVTGQHGVLRIRPMR